MIYVCKPTKISIYINSSWKTPDAIRKETGCDVVINGGLYDMKTYKPMCWLKKDGQLLASDKWGYWGYGWNDSRLVMDSTANIGKYRNYICCVALLRNGNPETLYYDPALGGKRGRTAIGVRANGDVVVCCAHDGSAYSMTPEQTQNEMKNCGCVSAIMLDGGGSSQCVTPAGSIVSPRIVQNLICIWTGEIKETIVDCPFPEPTFNVRRGSIGKGAKWVQWNLNRYGADLTVDGIFGRKSAAALQVFQAQHGLAADGICGKLTREALRK